MWQSFWDVRKPWSKILPKLLGLTKPLMGDSVLNFFFFFFSEKYWESLFCTYITTDINRRKQWVLKKRKKKHENYQQTKGVRISLHAYLTSEGWNKTPTIIVPKAVLRSNHRFLCHSLFTQTLNNTPLRIIWNNQIAKQYNFILPLSIVSREKLPDLILLSVKNQNDMNLPNAELV